MNISSINAYNNTVFTAKKQVKKHTGKYAKPQQNPITPAKVLGGAGIGTALALALIIPGCNNKAETKVEETIPTTSIVETFETEPTETEPKTVDLNAYYESMAINVKPEGQRVSIPKHKIGAGDRLTDIIIDYAGLDKNTQYKDLIPYIERLKLENPYVIKRVIRYEYDGKTLALPEYTLIYNPKQDNYLNLDSILEDNIIENAPVTPVDSTEPTVVETEPVETQPETSEEDTVMINGNAYCFDKGTLKKPLFGNYQGLMGKKFTTLDKKSNGTVELTKYEGIDSKSDVAFVLTYDQDKNIVEKVDYKNGKVMTITTYEYDSNSTKEVVVDKTAKGKQIDVVASVYDKTEDLVHSRVFSANKKAVVTFDFVNGRAQIGETPWAFVEFICNDDAIGSEKYVGITEEGNEIRFDILENGFNVEYVTAGEISARDQFDLAGNLIFSE